MGTETGPTRWGRSQYKVRGPGGLEGDWAGNAEQGQLYHKGHQLWKRAGWNGACGHAHQSIVRRGQGGPPCSPVAQVSSTSLASSLDPSPRARRRRRDWRQMCHWARGDGVGSLLSLFALPELVSAPPPPPGSRTHGGGMGGGQFFFS